MQRFIVLLSLVLVAHATAAPVISTQPGTTSASVGTSASLTVAASGAGPLTYQWRKFGEPIAGATQATLTMANAEFADAGLYDVVVGDGTTPTTSGAGRITVVPVDPPNVYRPAAPFGPRFEKSGGTIKRMLTAPDGKIYVVGDFSGLAGATSARVARFHPDGTADTTFTPAHVSDGIVHAIAFQPDGKLLLGGSFSRVGGQPRSCIARLNTDGTLDESFATGAGFSPKFSSDNPEVRDLIIQANGRIVAGGYFDKYREVERPNLLRLHPDGTLDTLFSTPLNTSDRVNVVVLQPDGALLVGGDFRNAITYLGLNIARLKPDGSRDTSFDAGSYIHSFVDAIALQPDGRVLVGAEFGNIGGVDSPPGIARLNSDGTRDTTFAPTSNIGSRVKAIAVLPGGDIIVGGRIYFTNISAWRNVARLATTGAHVASWHDDSTSQSGLERTTMALAVAGDGVLGALQTGGFPYYTPTSQRLIRLSTGAIRDPSVEHEVRIPAQVFAIESAPGGRWVIGGDFRWVNAVAQGGIAMLAADGSLDSSFSVGPGFDGPVHSLALDGAGRIIAGGSFTTFKGGASRWLARLTPAGGLDPTFLIGGGFTGNGPSEGDTVRTLALQADGFLIAGGQFNSYQGTSGGNPVRLRPDGTLDSAFTTGFPNPNSLDALGVQRDARILVGGGFSSFASQTVYGIVRLDSNGTRDPSLDPGTSIYTAQSIRIVDDAIIVGSSGRISRFRPDGTPDPSFTSPTYENMNVGRTTTIEVDGAGRIYFAGRILADRSIMIERALQDGGIDERFVVRGAVATTNVVEVNDLAFTTGRRILVGGRSLEFENGAGGALAMLEPAPSPVIVHHPTSVTAAPGATVTFSVTATGENVRYQWQHNGVNIAGATSATLTLTNVQLVNAGEYAVVLSNDWEVVTSTPVSLSGTSPAPVISVQPVSIEATATTSAALSVSAAGSGPFSYQWRKFGSPIPGATGASMPFSPVEFADAGFYDVIVGDGLSATVSQGVEVRVHPPSYPNVLRPRSFGPRFELSGGTFSRILPAPGGGFVAAGNFTRVEEAARAGLARFHADGSLIVRSLHRI